MWYDTWRTSYQPQHSGDRHDFNHGSWCPHSRPYVVLICEHNEQGSFGLVLNQTTELLLDDVMEDDIYPDIPLYVGGPVEKNTLHYIFIYIKQSGQVRRPNCRVTTGQRKWGPEGTCVYRFSTSSIIDLGDIPNERTTIGQIPGKGQRDHGKL